MPPVRENLEDSTKGPPANQLGWLENDVVNPFWNNLIVKPASALHLGLAARPVQPDSSTIGSVVQEGCGIAGSLLPYLVASKLGGGLLRMTAAKAALSGTLGNLAVSERVGSMLGASIYDAARAPDTAAGETRSGNFLSSLTTFYLYGAGNRAFAEATLAGRILGRAATGAIAADAGQLVANVTNQGRIADGYADTALHGMVFNSLFPLAHEGIANLVDRTRLQAGLSLSASRFIQQAGLAGRVDGMAEAVKAAPYARVRFNENPVSDKPGTINVPRLSNPDLQADILRTQLLNEQVAARGSSAAGAILSNLDVLQALQDGRIEIGNWSPDQLKPYAMDIRLGTRFLKQPAAEVRDFYKGNAKSFLSNWSRRGLEQEYQNGIVLAPGETALGFTHEKITLRRVPTRDADGAMQDWQGRPPVKVDINQKSTLARHDLRNHQTAPSLYPGETDHEVVLEIKNDGPAPVKLKPGMRFGSLTFQQTKSHALPDYNANSVAGQTSVAGIRGPQETRTINPTGWDCGISGWLKGIVLPYNDYSTFNGPARLTLAQPYPLPAADYSKLPALEAMRHDPARQDEYLAYLQARQRS